MKYRIIQTSKGFEVQQSLLGWFWHDYMQPKFFKDCGTLYYSNHHVTITHFRFQTAERAEEYLMNNLKHKKYKGHRLRYVCFTDGPAKYVDMSVHHSCPGYPCFNVHSETYEGICKQIDDIIRERHQK